jgi:hypothetical protein
MTRRRIRAKRPAWFSLELSDGMGSSINFVDSPLLQMSAGTASMVPVFVDSR